MKKLLTMIMLAFVINSFAQHSVTLTSGRVIQGKITSITSENIIIRQDSMTVLTCPKSQVSTYFDGGETRISDGNEPKEYNEDTSTAGDELIQTAKIYYAGFAVSTIGLAGALIIPSFYKTEEGDTEEIIQWKSETRQTIQMIGGAVAIVGYIVQVTAFSHLKLAGKKLNVTASGAGLGVSMKF